MTNQQTFNEMLDSLTGYEEEAIEKQFGADISTLLGTQATKAVRAAVFISKRRDGLKDAEAKKAAMDLTIAQANEFYDEDEDDIMTDDPETEAGKEPSELA